jgi:hypothetical protein
MPAVSFYLKEKVLESVRAKAAASKIPVSQIISEAVEQYLQAAEKREAKERLLHLLEEKPFGGMKAWKELHKERTEADDCRR